MATVAGCVPLKKVPSLLFIFQFAELKCYIANSCRSSISSISAPEFNFFFGFQIVSAHTECCTFHISASFFIKERGMKKRANVKGEVGGFVRFVTNEKNSTRDPICKFHF